VCGFIVGQASSLRSIRKTRQAGSLPHDFGKDVIMFNKQVFAQVGVFLLLAVNVAAYWFLWPNYHSVSSNEGKAPTQEKGVTRLVPEMPPKTLSPASLKDAVPLSIPVSKPPVEQKTPDQETLSKLVDHIKKESGTTAPLDIQVPAFEEKPMPPPNEPKPLPVLPAEPLRSDNAPLPTPGIAVASALTPKMPPSPWLLSMEMVGTRTQLHAKVRQTGTANVLAEFKIICDRVEMKAPGGELQALGKVTIVGAGLNAECQRLILPIHEMRLVFEDQAQILQAGGPGSVLRGERITWELPAAPVAAQPIAPGDFRPADILPPALALPK
jgi:hypothetical protein